MRKFTKIKYRAGDKVTLEWTERSDRGKTEVVHRLESKAEPAAALPEALAAFVPRVLQLIEAGDGYGAGFTVVGLSINYEGDGRCGLVVTCLKKLEGTNAPLVLNTPHLREAGDEPVGVFLPAAWLTLLDAAQRAADAFVDGTRGQVSLFPEATGELLDGIERVTISTPGSAPVVLTGKQFKKLSLA